MSTSWHSPGKIYAIGHANILDIFSEDVEITEKIDGSFCAFGKFFDGKIKIRSRNQEFDINAPNDMFVKAAETVKQLAPNLQEGWTYRGEYLQKPKHNTLAYNRAPNNNIILFDIATGHESYLSYEDKVKEAARIGLELVPLIYEGKVSSSDEILKFMDRESILGGQKIEGVVVKNYKRFGSDGKVLMGKYVSEQFKEVHNEEWKKSNPKSGDIIQRLQEKYRTPARWNKSIMRLKERGELLNDPKDIGNLMKEVQTDIEAECKEEIKEALYSWARKEILRHSVKGIAEFYKDQLLKKAFE
jgi:hypothetical protein